MIQRSPQKVLVIFFATFIIACGGGSAPKAPKADLPGQDLLQTGMELYQRGCFEKARVHFLKANEQYSALDFPQGVAISLNNIGNIYRLKGDFEQAIRYYREAGAIFSEIKDAEGTIQVLSNMAALLTDADRLEEADKTLDTAFDIAGSNKITSASLLKNRGLYFLATGENPEAEVSLGQALEAMKGETATEFAATYFAMGRLMAETGRTDEALNYLEKARALDQKMGFSLGVAQDLEQMGEIFSGAGDYGTATGLYSRCLKIYALIGDGDKAEDVAGRLREVAQKSGVDISLTEQFVKEWTEAGTLSRFCR